MIKNFTKRDSATAFLRKLGISKIEYDRHITKIDGGFEVDYQPASATVSDEPKETEFSQLVQSQLVKKDDPAPEVKKAKVLKMGKGQATSKVALRQIKKAEPKKPNLGKGKKADKVDPKKLAVLKEELKKIVTPKTEKVTVSSRSRDLIRKGMTNPQVFAALQKEFGLSDDKKWYPCWYRNQMRRKGEKV